MEVVKGEKGKKETVEQDMNKEQDKPTYEQLEAFVMQVQQEASRVFKENEQLRGALQSISADKFEFLIGASIDILKLDGHYNQEFEDKVYNNLMFLYEENINNRIQEIKLKMEETNKETMQQEE